MGDGENLVRASFHGGPLDGYGATLPAAGVVLRLPVQETRVIPDSGYPPDATIRTALLAYRLRPLDPVDGIYRYHYQGKEWE